MSKPWLEHYPPGIPHTIAPSPFASLAEFFDDACVDGAALPAYTNFGVTMSYAQLHQRAQAFANYLRNDAGLQTGDRAALMMPNLLQYPVALFGVLLAGMTVVNTNPLYTAPELRYQLSDSGAKAIVAVENYASVLVEIRDQLPLKAIVLTGIGDLLGLVKGLAINVAVKYIKKQVSSYDLPDAVSFKQALAMGTAKAFKRVALASDDLAFLQYTGGTTGVAKGAMLSHGNILANVEQSAQWLMQTGRAGKSLGMRCETVITALPLYHIFSLTAKMITEDGWLRTGDIARMDERGYFYLVDRLKDIVVVSGFNVYPTEVEQVLNNHPQVLECGVIGVPDERSGEAVMAVVVRNDQGLHEDALNQDSLNQALLNQDALRSWARESLTAYKIPKHIEFSDELPKSNVGKILRRELVARYNPNAE
ncbi:MAG: AMP-binding protein [Porticoccaceae bacterium]